MQPLPVDPYLPEILSRVREARAAVITAPPGAGKTTRIAPALAADGPLILLQPRRVAARSIARRIADERGWTLGKEVGWHVRFERRFGPDTQVIVATEGILTARLQGDPLLSGFRTIVLDEFHERSLHADLGLALARQAWLARDNLRIVVMSATLDPQPVAAFLRSCPSIDVPGRAHPVSIAYAPGEPLARGVVEALSATRGQVLCFLPGAPEIARATREVAQAVAGAGVEIVPLHGSLDAAAQDEAVRESATRRVILATNIAETSLTVPGVTAVVDTGLQKVARFDASRSIDSLDTERISRDAADQRAGRAGRLEPGLARRLWDERDRLRLQREPEIERVDLSPLVLDVLAWGGDPGTLEWFQPPPPAALAAAMDLLARLGAVEHGRLTDLGHRLRRFPLHPRLARILVAGSGAPEVAAACALLAERRFMPARTHATASDLLSAIDDWSAMPAHVRHVAQEIGRLAAEVLGDARRPRLSETAFRQAILAGYPDRVGRRRAPGSPRVLLSSGHGASVAPESGVREGEFLVAVDVQSGARGEGSEARIRLASAIDGDWLVPNRSELVHRFDRESETVRALAVEKYDELPLTERPVEPDPEIAAQLVGEAFLARGLTHADRQLLRRLRFAGIDVDPDDLVRRAAQGATALRHVRLAQHLPPEARAIDRLAPESLKVPSGRTVPLEYQEDGTVSASVRLQELFGLAETPRIGPRHEPVLLSLLAPNGRPVQITRDLRSFWDAVYPEVRKELRGRYPKHAWPDDPWTATPTSRATRKP